MGRKGIRSEWNTGNHGIETSLFFSVSRINACFHVDENFLLAVEGEAGYTQRLQSSPCEIQSSGRGCAPRRNQKTAFVVLAGNAD